MTTLNNNFARIWTERFGATNRISSAQQHDWCDQLHVHRDLNWQRMVCNNWLGQPLVDHHSVVSIVDQLLGMGHECFFITARGTSVHSTGMQIWSAEPDLCFVVNLMSAPVLHHRSYTAQQFEDQTSTMIEWKNKL